MCIYSITNPNGKVYIGATTHLYARLSTYCSYYRNGVKNRQQKLLNSFQKYTLLAHSVKVVREVQDIEELGIWEAFYVEHLGTATNGLNLTSGGLSAFRHTPETLAKIAQANTGRKRSSEHCRKMSEARKGRPSNRRGVVLSEETRQRISETKKARKLQLTPEHKKKIGEASRGRTHSKATKQTLSSKAKQRHETNREEYTKRYQARCRPILQFTMDGAFIRETTRTELRSEGHKVDTIKRCLLGKCASSGGFLWKYKNNEDSYI